MDKEATFEAFFDLIHLDSAEAYKSGLEGIARTLNKEFYDSSDSSEHLILVGSAGRGTAVVGASDVDVIFDLPDLIYKQFDNYETNGQSALLQKVKETLAGRYPRTEMRADGQVIVIVFTDRNYSIELVPAFRQKDDSFLFPDTHDGGSWKKTEPFSEQEASSQINEETSGVYSRFCNALRVWRDTQGFVFGGLLIDTLVYNYINKDEQLGEAFGGDYIESFKRLFDQLSRENPSQSYWLALGSNQQIKNKEDAAFVERAKKASDMLAEASTEWKLEGALCDLFGKRFKDSLASSEIGSQVNKWCEVNDFESREEFIEDLYPVAIRYPLVIDCKVTQDGFRSQLLSKILSDRGFLRKQRSLEFYIVTKKSAIPKSGEIRWKVRNCGEVAYRKGMVRGEIIKGNGHWSHTENADFDGPHFVECYCIQNGICVARARIDVPIA